MSHYTKGRTAGYYNDLLIGDDHDFFKLVKKYAIWPPNDIEGRFGKLLGHFDANASADPRLGRSSQSRIELKRMHQKIAYVNLKLNPRGVTGAGAEGDMITFDSTYTPTANYVPVYFLPWMSQGGSVRLTIPGPTANQGPSTAINAADPYIFFTAAINGCSIFFRGTTQNPTIFHCGGGTGIAAGPNQTNEQAEFWEAVMDVFVGFDDGRGKQAKLGAYDQNHGVDKRDYITAVGVTNNQFGVGGIGGKSANPTTLRAKSYYKDLKLKHALGTMQVRSVNPSASVFGRRDDAGHWAFYMQEIAVVTYRQYYKSLVKHAQGNHYKDASVARPLIYREIWPNGPGQVTVKAGLPSIL